MDVTITGVVIGLAFTILLSMKGIPPTYSMITGALAAGIAGGVGLQHSILFMVEGSQMIIPAILRVIAAGVFAGVLIESGAAETIAKTIVRKLGTSKGLLAIMLAAFLLTAVGIFILVSILIVAPIALAIAKDASLSKPSILLAMVGGGKTGMLVAPGPSAIAASETFQISLSTVIYTGVFPALAGLAATYFLSSMLASKGSPAGSVPAYESSRELPSFSAAIAGPALVIFSFIIQPLLNITVDPLILLPLGGIISALAMGQAKELNHFMKSGLLRMSDVSLLLIGTGTIAGIISHSEFKPFILTAIEAVSAPSYLIAPISGVIMSAATGTSTAATVITGNVFSSYIVSHGVEAAAGAAMVHAGSVVFDALPHSPFFHATQRSVAMGMKERLGLISYEVLIGMVIVVVSTLIFGVFSLRFY